MILAMMNPYVHVLGQHQRHETMPVPLEKLQPVAHDCEATTPEGNANVTVAGATIAKDPVTGSPNVSAGTAASTATTEYVYVSATVNANVTSLVPGATLCTIGVVLPAAVPATVTWIAATTLPAGKPGTGA
jgi:hypothetical protein